MKHNLQSRDRMSHYSTLSRGFDQVTKFNYKGNEIGQFIS